MRPRVEAGGESKVQYRQVVSSATGYFVVILENCSDRVNDN